MVVLGIIAFIAIIVTTAVNQKNAPFAAKNPAETQDVLTTPTVAITNLAQGASFEVELKEGVPRGNFLVCNVTFNGTLPPPEAVDKILHDSLQSAAQSHPTREILAMAIYGDDGPTENQYSGDLIYKPAERRIMTLAESRGEKTQP